MSNYKCKSDYLKFELIFYFDSHLSRMARMASSNFGGSGIALQGNAEQNDFVSASTPSANLPTESRTILDKIRVYKRIYPW